MNQALPLFPLTIIQRSLLIMRFLSLCGLLGPLAIVGGVVWGLFDTQANQSVTILVMIGGVAVLAYMVLTLLSFLLVKRGTLVADQATHTLNMVLNDVETKVFYDQIKKIVIARQVRRFLQPKYWMQYSGATYRIWVTTNTGKHLFEWDSIFSHQEDQPAVMGEDLVTAFVQAGIDKQMVQLKQGSWKWLLMILGLGALVWFVFFF